ncbi:MAG: carbohydrate porin, partial [Rhodocyclales bacterium]|nr:carbohydrate porin [Rhodocyclales bacterium]
HDAWALRAGRFIQPRDPNGLALDFQIFNHYGDQLELEHAHTLAGQPGKLRALVFRNVAPMSRFSDAIALGAATSSAPNLNLVRGGDRVKYGLGLNLEQALSDDLGFFARASWADGKTETYAFTEVDRSLSAGFLLQGTRWGRAEDTLGIAWVGNQISKGRRTYLEDGGISFFIGDGALNARAENVIETFYNYQLFKALSVGLDYQHIRNPAYNGDRGPINVGSVRLHLEF